MIKLGALGDWVLATGPFSAIRQHHATARITLLTLPEFADWGARCGWFDEIWANDRPGWAQPFGWLKLRRRLIDAGFVRVYDLQTSDRSSLYYHLIPRRRRPEWSGVARGCSHPHGNPKRDFMHTVARQAEQLGLAGIDVVPAPSLDWLDADLAELAPPGAFALLVPGGSVHRPDKRWPAARYAALARALLDRDVTPVLIGTALEAAILEEISKQAPGSTNLGGRTSLNQIAALARRARYAVGNDTGPMHIVATSGCPTVSLFSDASDPALCAPRGSAVAVLRRAPLADLPVGAALDAVAGLPARA